MQTDGLFAIFRYMETTFGYIAVAIIVLVGILAIVYMVHVQSESKRLIDSLYTFYNLSDGWDGYDAPSIDLSVINRARDIAFKMEDSFCMTGDWELFPTGRSTVQFERRGLFGKNYYEIEVYPDYYVYYAEVGKRTYEATFTDMDAVVNIMKSDMRWHWLKWYFWFPKNVRKK